MNGITIGGRSIHYTIDEEEDQDSELKDLPDMGDMTLAVLDDSGGVFAAPRISGATDLFVSGVDSESHAGASRARGSIGTVVELAAGESTTVAFAVAWRFPNQRPPIADIKDTGHYYAKRFPSSLAVVAQHAGDHEASYARTRLWHDTWYDSTLPHWLLDRTFVNTSILATSTCLRFESGRLWGWEGVGCCAGTCQHVWHAKRLRLLIVRQRVLSRQPIAKRRRSKTSLNALQV
ncbi:MAG: hypothetical protein GY906_03730, partial [bacterium]|nr:hypothetical protein [bacterium]